LSDTGEKVFQHEFFDTTSAADFVFGQAEKPPDGYPSAWTSDKYSDKPFAPAYEKRREAFFAHILKNPAPPGIKGWYYELVRIHLGIRPVHTGLIRAALKYINERRDCSDFVMLGIVRLIYQFAGSDHAGRNLMDSAAQTLIDFKYWPDEPGIDSMCYWTENHQIMFSANEYLAGQLFPERRFSNSGMTGIEKMARARPRIMKWLELRYLTGFSEWLSNVYYDEDITALVNLIDFCADEEIVSRSKIVLDLVFLDMALNSFRGCFGSTHGRSYRKEKMSALVESTTDTFKLMFGTGVFAGHDNMSAVSLALSGKYRLPETIFNIANDNTVKFVNRQRMGINVKDAARWGLDLKNPDDLMTMLSMEAYTHPLTFKGVMGLFDRFRWWDNQFFSMFGRMKGLIKFMCATGIHGLVTRYFEKDITRNLREEVNVYTYRTPDYMLSSAVDYKPGYGGDQQHIWQATLGPETVCFTTHPGHEGDTSAGYWVGSGTLPRVAQHENVLIACYRISKKTGIYMTNKLFFTHAYFPRDRFDEVVSRSGWTFGRKGKAYIALYSQKHAAWKDVGDYRDRELVAAGLKNIWVCEMGSAPTHGSFSEFVEKVSLATIIFEGDMVKYNSPSKGLMQFSFDGSFIVKGKKVELKGYPRYDNPFAGAVFPPKEILVRYSDGNLRLDFNGGIRDEGKE
jgi:hypothetical protein